MLAELFVIICNRNLVSKIHYLPGYYRFYDDVLKFVCLIFTGDFGIMRNM